MKVQVHKIRNASDEEKKAFRAAALWLGAILDDEDFWRDVAVNYYRWTNKKQMVEFIFADQTFSQFKEMVLSGADKFNTESDGDIDIDVTYYYSFKKVVGYTKASTWRTWTNRHVVSNYDVADIAGHQGHEYGHNMGLGHTNADRNSVVYQFGYMIRKHIKIQLGLSDINIIYKRSFWGNVKRFFGRIF